MEAELNTLTIPEETSREIFFREESRRLHEAFDNKDKSENLYSLRSQLKNLKDLVVSLQLPWDRCIPILFRSFAHYMKFPDGNANNRKVYQTTALLMDSVTTLSQNKREIFALTVFLDRQIADLDRLIAAKEQPAE